jgi:hypothetical protein
MAICQDIIARVWTRIVEFDVERSFTCGPRLEIAANQLVFDTGWSLFTFDFKRRNAIFLRTPESENLSQAPFVYTAQFEKATHVATVDFDEFFAITDALPDVPKLVQFFSTGHCGSTLLHQVFNRVPDVACISEPIAFNALALNGAGENEATKLKLARGALRLLTRFPGVETAGTIVIKHFSQSTLQIKLLSDAQPNSQKFFLYRDALSWANSAYHFVQKYGTPMTIPKDQRALLWRILSGGLPESVLEGIIALHADVLNFDALSAVAWATQIQYFEKAVAADVAIYSLRYNEVIANRNYAVATLFEKLGLPVDAVAATLSVFDRHAHEGTRSARKVDDLHFDQSHYDVVRSVLSHPRIAIDPNIILPSV